MDSQEQTPASDDPAEVDPTENDPSENDPSGPNAREFDQTELDGIAEEFSAAIRSGESPSVDAFVAKYSDAPAQLRGLLESIEMIERLKPKPPRSVAHRPAPRIEQLDDYKIIREIGRGGMGIVYEALHQSLGRRVAIKVLANGLLGDPKHLARFRREARAAARLRHTHIVPVFGVGKTGEHHYYVMDFIDGMSLQQWIETLNGRRQADAPTVDATLAMTDRDLKLQANSGDLESNVDSSSAPPLPTSTGSPEYFRWVAALGATTADALQYAHSRGVLHRDIKPANLLIDPRGEVWIADFGLAKLTEQQAVTKTGDVVGTPQYMPPESFDGTYDVTSEVYGVGLTLYELLTLRPAIEGRGTADTIRKAIEGVTVPPRKINSSVPRDLETIVLKALSQEPKSRYPNAAELRDDLQRFLTDRPITARRSSPIERAIRWSRREPTIAMLTFTTFILLVALLAVSVFGYFRTKSALEVAEAANRSATTSLAQRSAALETADQQRRRAEGNLQVAVAAFDEVMQNISNRGVESGAEFLGEVTDTTSPNVTPEDAKLLRSLLGFFDELATNNSRDLLAESAVAAQHTGDIFLRLGQLREADQAFGDAIDRYEKLAAADPNDVTFILSQAQLMNELAVITALRGQLGRASQLFPKTIALLESSSDAMGSAAGRFEYARANRIYASHGTRTGLDDVIQGPRSTGNLSHRGPMKMIRRLRTDGELSAVDKSITILDSLIEDFPEVERYRAELARAFRDKATIASRTRKKAEAENAVRRSIELFDDLLSENPESDAIRYELALTLSSAEAFNFNQMRRAVRASELSIALLETSPELPRYQALRAHTLETLASNQMRIGKLDAAERNLNDALRIYHSLIQDSPELIVYERLRSQTLESLADIKLRLGDREAAVEYLERAIRRLRPRLRRAEATPVVRMQLQRLTRKLTRIEDNP